MGSGATFPAKSVQRSPVNSETKLLLLTHAFLKGRMRDMVVYSIIAHEWEGVKRNLQMRLARR
jgi:hypothetical protein